MTARKRTVVRWEFDVCYLVRGSSRQSAESKRAAFFDAGFGVSDVRRVELPLPAPRSGRRRKK